MAWNIPIAMESSFFSWTSLQYPLFGYYICISRILHFLFFSYSISMFRHSCTESIHKYTGFNRFKYRIELYRRISIQCGASICGQRFFFISTFQCCQNAGWCSFHVCACVQYVYRYFIYFIHLWLIIFDRPTDRTNRIEKPLNTTINQTHTHTHTKNCIIWKSIFKYKMQTICCPTLWLLIYRASMCDTML